MRLYLPPQPAQPKPSIYDVVYITPCNYSEMTTMRDHNAHAATGIDGRPVTLTDGDKVEATEWHYQIKAGYYLVRDDGLYYMHSKDKAAE